MTLAVIRPAPLAAMADMLAADGLPVSARKAFSSPQAVARAQGSKGRSWGYLETASGCCVACAGLFPQGDGGGVPVFEAWFLCRPAARRHMLAFLRLAHLTLRAALEDGPVEIVARTAALDVPGGRMARLLGFSPAGVEAGAQIWRLPCPASSA